MVVTQGIRTTRGSRLYEDFVPDEDSPIAERLRAGGAILLGKTNAPELGWKGATDNLVFGPTRNPWNLERTQGGSSGGASAQVAARARAAGDRHRRGRLDPHSGVVRRLLGLKPSFGRVCGTPPSALEPISTRPMTWHVRDAALLMNVIAGPDERDRNSLPGRRCRLPGRLQEPASRSRHQPQGLAGGLDPDLGYAPVEPEVRRVAEAAARRFAELGCEVEEVRLGWPCPRRDLSTCSFTAAWQASSAHGWTRSAICSSRAWRG